MSYNYGLSEFDLKSVKEKLAKQKDYLKKNNFLSSSGVERSLLDISYASNHSGRIFSGFLEG